MFHYQLKRFACLNARMGASAYGRGSAIAHQHGKERDVRGVKVLFFVSLFRCSFFVILITGAPCLSSPPTPRNGRVFCSGEWHSLFDQIFLAILSSSIANPFTIFWQHIAIPIFVAVHLKLDFRFTHGTFAGGQNFIHRIFPGDQNFIHGIFSGGQNFIHWIFSGGQNFIHGMFSVGQNFIHGIFSGGQNFILGIFLGGQNFIHGLFSGGQNFIHGIFLGGQNFIHGIFIGGQNFSHGIFSGGQNECSVRCLPGHAFPDGTTESELLCHHGVWDAVEDCKPVCDPPCQVLCGLVRCGLVWYSMVWFGMIWFGMVCFITPLQSD